MKIFDAQQIKKIDEYTITHEPVKSTDLMERAAKACCTRIVKLIGQGDRVLVVCGMGNNGGDGLAITRLLLENNYDCNAVVLKYAGSFSEDAKNNYDKLLGISPQKIKEINSISELSLDNFTVIIDAILGTGLNKPVEGLVAEVITAINKKKTKVISIDVPSGLYIDRTSSGVTAINSTLTLTFQFPKFAFLLPENCEKVPEFEILDIGLHPEQINSLPTNYYYITQHDIAGFLKPRNKFSHKGTYGHALLLAGSEGKSGAAVISAKSCMRSGAGLLTVHSNPGTLSALLHHLPEAMGSNDPDDSKITELVKTDKFDAIGIGPGIGTHEDTQQVVKKLLNYYAGKLIIDADGLNILSENKTWLSYLPLDTILTPHPKEFERLTEKTGDDFERLKILKQFSLKYNCIVVLKGSHSAIAMPDGNIFFNSSGNSGLAKAGTGDGLTGIILGLLARGYNPPQAALIGTFIHGYAADLCIKKTSKESLLISDVIEMLPKAFRKVEIWKVKN
jgi:ADP-dependent NAD(P)H-hydrate dehydratase / NAD(P)H-hydrate epimerase